MMLLPTASRCARSIALQTVRCVRSRNTICTCATATLNGTEKDGKRTGALLAMATSPTPTVPPTAAVDFLLLVHQLKVNKRTGWVRRGIPEPESIADHMYRMGVMALLFAGSSIDYQRCMMMALVHDMAEAIVGDITPHCGVSPEEKKRLEADAVQQMKAMLGAETPAAQLIEELWREYEAAATPCAQLVKDFDKVEMILQAYEYELQHGRRLQEFYDSTRGKFKTPVGQAWAAEVVARRDAYWLQKGQPQ